MNDTDKPRRGNSGDDDAASGSAVPESGNSGSSVEKAAEKMSIAQEAVSQARADDRAAPAQTSSIERFLNANDGDAPGGPATPPTIIEDDITRVPVAATPAPPAAESAPAAPANVAPPAADAVPDAAVPEAAVPEAAAPETAAAPAYAPADPVQSAETPGADTPGADAPGQVPEESLNPYRAAHPDPEDPPQVSRAPENTAGDQPKRGLLRRRNKASKPWHRDHAAAQAGEQADGIPAAAQPAQMPEAEVPAKKRGVFGMLWATIRFLLIGRKRPRKNARQTPQGKVATTGRPAGGRGLRLPSALKLPRLGAVPRMPPFLAARIGKVPGLRRLTHTKAEVAAEIERVAAETPAGIAEIAAETRRSAAGSHIRRPLDMSRRVGRTVEIDIESIRAAGMVTPSGERTHIAEEFRLIKRPLLLNAFEKGANAIRNGNVIMVASSRSGEGKTFMAVNLAMSIASERDLTVLLIDADVAKPDIPNVLGFEADLGLVDLIADDQIDMSEVIMRTNIENLSVMPAGRPHHLATELLASERMGNLVSELSLRYPERVVIMDSPPALLSSVAGVLALNVGQTLFVVEAERTSQTAVDSAIGLVSACKNINLLLNKSRPLGGGERFGSYQSSYY